MEKIIIPLMFTGVMMIAVDKHNEGFAILGSLAGVMVFNGLIVVAGYAFRNFGTWR